MRLFVAVETPEAIRRALDAWIGPLRAAFPRAHWVPAKNLHVTLKFIGDASAESLDALRAALRAMPRSSPIEIKFRGAGFFPNDRRPRVLWAGIEAGPELAQLAQAVDQALEPAGVARETREFRPHLTVARFPEKYDAAGLARLRETLAADSAPDFGAALVAEFQLYRSVLQPTGAEYTRLDSFDFTRSDAQPHRE
jgi:RNA 2',3'-cyclic 3'-phosphodiesterase